MEKINEANDSYSSHQESGIEQFDWIDFQNFPKKLKKFYTEYPLKKWKDIIFENKEPQINDEGLYYQGTVNKILRIDVFEDCNFYDEKKGAINFNFKKKYNIDFNKLIKKKIAPDFFVFRMEKKDFFNLVKSREYMMKLHYEDKIPKKAKFISILGEIKSSFFSCHTENIQRADYETFIDLANELNDDEYIILMYIYDNSFSYFQRDYYVKPEKERPIIYSYAPKLYYEDCYYHYNRLIDKLKLKQEKIDLNDKTVFKKKRRELEEEIKKLTKENKLLRGSNKKGFYIIIIISLLFGLILAYLLNKKNLIINFNK